MIWFRRLIAAGLVFFSLLLLISAVLLTEVNNTAANPEFYNDQLERADAYNFIYDDALPAALDEIEEDETSDLPVDMADFKSDLVTEARKIFPPDWLKQQAESIIAALVPYFRGSTDEFTIIIPISDKVDPTADAIIEIFADQQTYDHLLEEIITPKVEEELGSGVYLPFEVSLSQEEIASTLKQSLPETWIHEIFVQIVRACADYVKGDTETISVEINLADNKAEARDTITALTDLKLEEIFNSLPEVSMDEFLLAIQDLPQGTIPGVRPEGQQYADFKDEIDLVVSAWVEDMVVNQMPDQWTFGHENVMAAIGTDLGEILDDVRENVATGYTKTEADLRDEITEGDGNPDDLDQVRETINTGRTWLWVVWAISLIMLLGAGLLIARSLRGKLLWFLGLVFVIFLIFYVAVGVGYSYFAEPAIRSTFEDSADHESFDAVMDEKGNELTLNATDTFASGIQRICIYTMIASGVAYIGVNLGLRRRSKGEGLQDENIQAFQNEKNVVLLDENGEALQDEHNEVLQNEWDEIVPGESDDVSPEGSGESGAGHETPPDASTKMPEE